MKQNFIISGVEILVTPMRSNDDIESLSEHEWQKSN